MGFINVLILYDSVLSVCVCVCTHAHAWAFYGRWSWGKWQDFFSSPVPLTATLYKRILRHLCQVFWVCCSLFVCLFMCHTWILAGQMQPSCHMFGSTSSWRKRHRWMGNHRVQAHYIFHWPNHYAHPLFSFNLFTLFSSSTIMVLCLLVASCFSDDCTVHSLLINQSVT